MGIRDLGALESAVAQPRMTFNGEELYPLIVEKASALGFLLIQNRPFVDGNKRAGRAAIEAFLMFNGYDIFANADEQVEIVLGVGLVVNQTLIYTLCARRCGCANVIVSNARDK